ncbi:MAG: hypothetical protein K6G51_02180 [Sphaerochaetaceae bacterium]|nr:hypothetical protein [Sphaerochaetaceae bacterium]
MKKSVIKMLSVMLITLLVLCACSNDSSSDSSESEDSLTFSSDLRVFLNSSNITILNKYESDYFLEDACTFDKDLALLSSAIAFSSSSDNTATNLNDMLFEDIEQHINEDDINGSSYVIGHRKVGDYELVAFCFNTIGYTIEWAGNFILGDSGNHAGFEEAAENALSDLKTYLDNYCSQDNLKLWITGYSRTAAIADIIAVNIEDNDEIEIAQEDFYVYAFAPPMSVSSSGDYPYIHNIYLESDIIFAMPPADYGLSQPGVNHKMTTTVDNLNECLHNYISSDLNMETFSSGSDYSTPTEFLEYFVNKIVTTTSDNSVASLESRSTYNSTIQPYIVHLAEVLMKEDGKGLDALKNYATNNKIVVLTWIFEDNFYNSLSAILDDNNIEYDADVLKVACSLVPDFYATNQELFNIIISQLVNIKYICCCHFPEVYYSILKETEF